MPFVIDDDTNRDIVFPKAFGRGHDPAQVRKQMYAPLAEIDIIDPSEWDARIDEQDAQESSLEHLWLRQGKPHLDQGQYGYCWGHSTAHAVMMQRAAAHQPYVPLSAFAVCAIIKNGRNEGGWCGLSAEFGREHGFPAQQFWPQGSASLKYDTPEMRANMALHKITADFRDVTAAVYDQNMAVKYYASCLLQNMPCMHDNNDWGHSVCAVRWTRIEKGHYGPRILNSWKGWGENGFATLSGRYAKIDGSLCIVGTTPSRI